MKLRLASIIVPAVLGAFAMTASAQEVTAAAKLSVETTPIAEIIKNEKAKAALEAALPPIAEYYDQIGSMTLKDVAPMSQGALDEAKLKELQTTFDSIS